MTNTDFTARCMAGKALEAIAGKQDVIADLDTIRAGAAAGTTAVQPAALEDYQPKIDSTHKLDADLVDDTNSTNKFATQSQLDQIETNKNNILNLKTMGQYTMNGAYNSESGKTTFGALYKLALDSLGLDTSQTHHYMVYIYTDTVTPTAEILIQYGTYKHGDSVTHSAVYSSQITYYADNNQGTLVVSGATAPVKATVRYLD